MEVLVTDVDSQPVADVAVGIWGVNQVRHTCQGNRGRTNAAGICVQSNLRKGNYRVEAVGVEGVTCRVKPRELNQCTLIVEGRRESP